MKKTSSPPPPAGFTARSPSLADRARPDATAGYGARFSATFSPDFYRRDVNGLTVSSIGAGTYLGGCSDDEDRVYADTVAAALARGINFIDTAPNYRAQRSERAVGSALRQAIVAGTTSRAEVVICTKGGYVPLDGTIPSTRDEYDAYMQRVFFGPAVLHPDEVVSGGHSLAPRFLRYCIALSRQNLGVRSLDYYLLHNPEQQLGTITVDQLRPRIRAAFATLEEAASKGEIGAYGCATWNALRVPAGSSGYLSLTWLVDIAKEVAGDSHRFRAVQLPVNLGMSEGIREAYQRVGSGALVPAVRAASDLGLTVIASAPLMQGRLASGLPDGVREVFPAHRTDAQRALSFVRGLPGITTVLVGMRGETHLAENLESAGKPLPSS